MTKFNEIFANMDKLAEEKAAEKKQLRRAQAVACGAVAPCGSAEEFLYRLATSLEYEREQRRIAERSHRQLEHDIAELKEEIAFLIMASEQE